MRDNLIPNVFVQGMPVRHDVSAFVERKQQRDVLLSLLFSGLSVALIGPRRIGKTTFLHYIYRLPPGNFLPVFIDFQGLLTSMTSQLFHNIARVIQKQTATLDLSVDIAPQPEPSDLFEFLTTVSHQIADKRKTFLLLFDEFDTVSEAQRQALSRVLRAVTQHADPVAMPSIVFAGWSGLHTMMGDVGSPLANVLQTLMLENFTYEETHQLLRQGLSNEPEPSFRTFTDRVFHWTNGHPLLTQNMGYYAVEELNRDKVGELGRDLADRVVSEVMESHKMLLWFTRDQVAHKPDSVQLIRDLSENRQVRFSFANRAVETCYFADAIRNVDGVCAFTSRVHRRILEELVLESRTSVSHPEDDKETVLSTLRTKGRLSFSLLSVEARIPASRLSRALLDLKADGVVREELEPRSRERFYTAGGSKSL